MQHAKGVFDMCKASLESKRTMPAENGQTYGIGITGHGLGALHPMTESAMSCVVCVQGGTKLTLSNIPEDLQQKFGITDHEIVTFVDTGDNYHDELRFENATNLGEDGDPMVCEFADKGVIAYVGVPSITISPAANTSDADRVLEDA